MARIGPGRSSDAGGARRTWRPASIALRIVYWLAVLAISLAMVVGLVLFFESRDDSSLEDTRRPPAGAPLSSS